MPLGGGGLPFLPADLPQAAAQPSVQLAEHADALGEPSPQLILVALPAPQSDCDPLRDLGDPSDDAEGERLRKTRGEGDDTDTGCVGSKRKPACGEKEVDQ